MKTEKIRERVQQDAVHGKSFSVCGTIKRLLQEAVPLTNNMNVVLKNRIYFNLQNEEVVSQVKMLKLSS